MDVSPCAIWRLKPGAKTGLSPDEITLAYVNDLTPQGRKRARESIKFTKATDAKYSQVFEYDVSKLEPQVAIPHAPKT